MAKSRILVIGGTGNIGRFIARAGAALHHPTFVLVRPSTLSSKAELIRSFKESGISILEGSLDDHDSLVAAIKQVDVVISAVGSADLPKQTNIIAAIKEVGTIKRFIPSEFGTDVDRCKGLEPLKSLFKTIAHIRREVEEAQIPYTYVIGNGFAGTFAANLLQPGGGTAPPSDRVLIYGSGNVKSICVVEDDIGTYTVKAVDDPRTLNKNLHIRPPPNILTQNEMVALWEKKSGKTLKKEIVPEEKIRKDIKEASSPYNQILISILYNFLIEGDQCNFDLGPGDVEATSLYPEVKYTTIDEYPNKFL